MSSAPAPPRARNHPCRRRATCALGEAGEPRSGPRSGMDEREAREEGQRSKGERARRAESGGSASG